MQDNFQVKNAEAQQVITDECVIAHKVYGKCRQQDCLKPVDANTIPNQSMIQIDSSRSGEIANIANAATSIFAAAITPNSIIAFNSTVAGVQLVPNTFKIQDLKVINVQANPFGQNGFYDVTIKYTFAYELNLLDINGAPIPVTIGAETRTNISAYTTYTKLISLFGGEAADSTIVTANTLYDPQVTFNEGNIPYTHVHAIANPLTRSVGTYVVGGVTEYHADITIGLFTIIKLYRIVSMLVASGGNCEVPTCDPIQPGDPCDYFNSLPFPFDEFDPPTTSI
jgi:hypothetical protein